MVTVNSNPSALSRHSHDEVRKSAWSERQHCRSQSIVLSQSHAPSHKHEYGLQRKSASKADFINVLESATFSRTATHYVVQRSHASLQPFPSGLFISLPFVRAVADLAAQFTDRFLVSQVRQTVQGGHEDKLHEQCRSETSRTTRSTRLP